MKRPRRDSEVIEGYESVSEGESVNNRIWYVAPKKYQYQMLDDHPFVEAINKFTEMMRATMSDLVRNIGNRDDKISNMIKQVFGELELLPNLTAEERFVAAEMLVEKPNKMALFFGLQQEARLILVKRLLKST